MLIAVVVVDGGMFFAAVVVDCGIVFRVVVVDGDLFFIVVVVDGGMVFPAVVVEDAKAESINIFSNLVTAILCKLKLIIANDRFNHHFL